MRSLYVIAGVQPYADNPKKSYVSYYEGWRNGGYYFGPDVRKAKRFEWDEIVELMKEKSQLVYYGCSIIEIADVTFDMMEKNEELVRKYEDPLYAIPR